MLKARRVALMLSLAWTYKRHSGVFAGVQQYAHEHGWESIVDEYADDTLSRCSRKAVPYDGIIARATSALAMHSKKLRVPVVNVWFGSPVARQVPSVCPDHSAIGCLRAEHLLARGVRNFAALTCEYGAAYAAELEAFTATVGAVGYPCVSAQVPILHSSSLKNWRKTKRIIADWMERWHLPIGVYAATEWMGRLVVQMCHKRGWSVPEDVMIIAGGNEKTLCEHLRPTLTSVEVGYERIGYESARLLDRLIDGEKPPKKPVLLPPQGLIVRESTDFSAVDDKVIAAALAFIAAKSHLAIGPCDVSRALDMEPRTLQNRFRKYLNRTIAKVICQMRIERAKRELAQGRRPIVAIARDVGFGNSKRLYEVFRRELGVTPKQYRRERQASGQRPGPRPGNR